MSACLLCGRTPSRICGKQDCPQRPQQYRHTQTGNTAPMTPNEAGALAAPAWEQLEIPNEQDT